MRVLKLIEMNHEALRRIDTPCDYPVESESLGRPLRIFVPYTKPKLTRSALAFAAKHAEGLNGRVTLMFVQVVPYPSTLDKPNIRCDILAQRLSEKIGSPGVPFAIEVILARDRNEALRSAIPAGSTVILTSVKRWWRTSEESLAHILSRNDCSVNLVYSRASALERFANLFLHKHYFHLNRRNIFRGNHA
jgi:hypothetical protein